MNTPLAQIVAIACHANASISGAGCDDFFPGNSTCRFCDYVRFSGRGKFLTGLFGEKILAANPNRWFDILAEKGALGVRLFRTAQNLAILSDRMSAGLLGGGGFWTMEVVLPGGRSEFWAAFWEVWNQNAPENRIWRVTYRRIRSGGSRADLPLQIEGASRKLAGALAEIRDFSARKDCGTYTKSFENALESLEKKNGILHGYHRDFAPAGFLSPEAESVLDACQTAWVFGGMGSWNDLWFRDDQKEYERVSDQLFGAINDAICAALDAGFPARPL